MPTSPFRSLADRVLLATETSPGDPGGGPPPANVVVVLGDDGALVVDPRPVAGGDLVGALHEAGVRPRHVVLTHEGASPAAVLAALRTAWPDLVVHAHEAADANDLGTDPGTDLVRLSSVAVVDLGGRTVELVHPGRGPGAADVVVAVPDVGLLATGPLVVGDEPSPGPGCFPLEWPLSLDFVLQLLTDSSVVVPGRGAPVDRSFVEDQRAVLGVVAETIRDLAGRGVREPDALASADWPLPVDRLVHAVRRGYEQLPRAQKRLPLV